MTLLSVSAETCSGCGACVPTCPTQAVRRAFPAPTIDAQACTECLACVEVCPRGAIDRWLLPVESSR